jgi:hypothetical protein
VEENRQTQNRFAFVECGNESNANLICRLICWWLDSPGWPAKEYRRQAVQ